MSLRPDEFEKYLRDADPTPLGDALNELSLDIDIDAVNAVRELRELE